MAAGGVANGANGDLRRGIILLVVFALVVAGLYFVLKPSGKPIRQAERKITKITLPPPPPPPPPPEKPKPIEEPEDRIEEPKPQEQASKPDKPQDAPELTSVGVTGTDAFGAKKGDGTAGNRIGSCTGPNCGNGNGIGGGGTSTVRGFSEYQNVMARVVQRALKGQRGVNGRYQVVVNVSVAPTGEIRTARLAQSTGDRARDALIQSMLVGLRPDRATNSVPDSALIRVSVQQTS